MRTKYLTAVTALALALCLSATVVASSTSAPTTGSVPPTPQNASAATIDPDEEPPLAIQGEGDEAVEDQYQEYITLDIQSVEELSARRVYTDERQMERLLSFLPSAADVTEAPDFLLNPHPVEMTYTKGDATKTYLFYSNSYCVDQTNPEAPVWYTTSSALWDLLSMMTGWEPYAIVGEPVTYKGETVQKMYSLLYKNRTYHMVYNSADVQKIVDALEEKKPDEEIAIGNVGFLIFTDKGRYDIYLDVASDQELVNLSSAYVNDNPRIQWISYMDPSMIKSIEATATVGKDYSYTSTDMKLNVSLNTTDRGTIDDISKYLKNILVQPETRRTEKNIRYQETPKLMTVDITFESGTVYHIKTNGSALTIWASSMENEYLTYYPASSQMAALADYLSMMPGAQLKIAKD